MDRYFTSATVRSWGLENAYKIVGIMRLDQKGIKRIETI